MNDNEKHIEEFVKHIPFDTPDSEHRDELKRRLLNAFPKHRLRSTVHTVGIWRNIMKNRTAKLTAAAVIAIVVLGGTTFWPTGRPQNGEWWLGSPAAWGQEVIAELAKIEALVYRGQAMFVYGSGRTHVSGNWSRTYQARDRSREDKYYEGTDESTFGDNSPDSALVQVTWQVPEGKDLKTYLVDHEYQCYKIVTYEGRAYKRDPMKELRSYVAMLDKADRMLDTETFDGHKCVGFEIDRGKDGDTPKGRTDRIWFDVKTKLPVRIEKHGHPVSGHSGMTLTFIHDRFKYHVQIPAEDFEPKIPDGYLNTHPNELPDHVKRQRRELPGGALSKAGEQSGDSVSPAEDPDRDGLESRVEKELGTNPLASDTDGDGLSDYDEYCKYRTDPMKRDSDGDGKPDGDWDERREYTYTIRAICEIRPPSSMEMINDLYQDARPFDKKATLNDARVADVLIFPYAEAHVYAQTYPKKDLVERLKEYIEPTVSMNYSPEMKKQIDRIVEGSATDVAAIEKMLQWLNQKTRLVRELPHWEYLHVTDGKIVWHKSIGSPARNKQFLETNFLGDAMFKNKVHGTCSSTAIIRGTMFRAAGLPTRLVQTLPLMTRYSEDPEPLADRLRMRGMAEGYSWGPGPGGANHTYNEVFLNNRWVRVDNSIGTGPFVGDKLFVKAWSSADWNSLKEEWNDKRCFRALDVSDARPKYKTKSAGTVDLMVQDNGLTIKENADGSFYARIDINNKGSAPSPRFRVNFYAGDPDKGGRLLSEHGAGPIMPRRTWGERNSDLMLKPGEDTITVVIDPDNRVEESDETNNKASQTISTTVKVKPPEGTESAKVDIAVGDKDFDVMKVSDGLFRAVIGIYNEGSAPSPKFGVYFYAGDPDKGGRLLATHGAGPIMPGDIWREGTHPHRLEPGESTISVVVDPGNKVEESDETNNKASRTISTTVKVKPAEGTKSTRVDIAIEDEDLGVIRLSDRVFEVTISLRNRGSVPLPRFKVHFYAGDPDKGGRLLSPQNAGPIAPGDEWREYNPGLELRPGETVISVAVDPDNRVEESDETNNKVSRAISAIGSEFKDVAKVEAIQKVNLSGDDTLQVEAQASEGFNFPYYLFIPSGIDKDRQVHILVEPNNSGMASDDLGPHQAKALRLARRSYANKMASRLGVPLLVPTFPRPMPHTHSWAYTHALDIDTLELLTGKLKRIDLQLTAMIKHAQKLLRTNGFKINDKIFIHGFSASAKFCNRYSYLHPEMVKAAAAGGVNGLPTLPVREWNGYELPFPIGLAGIERFASKPFDDKAFMQVAHFIYMGSSDRNDTLLSPEAWRAEEAAIIRKALAAEKMMPDRWELSRKIYGLQKLPAQLVTYNGVGHSIKSQMLDDVIDFFKANAGEKYVPIEPYEYPSADPDSTARKSDETNSEASQTISTTVKIKPADSDESKVPAEMVGTWFFDNPRGDDEQMAVFPDGRVVALYSNGHKDQTNIVDGSIELAEFNNAKCRMTIQEDGSLVQYFDLYANSKQWKRIAPEPHTNLLRSLDN